MQDTTTRPAPLAFFPSPPTDAATAVADARLCAALGAMHEWAEAHGDHGPQDRTALWHGYRLSHELMMAFWFCAVDGAAFGGRR